MNIFTFEDYRRFLQAWLKSQPKSGRGIAQKVAAHLRVSTVLVSQVLNGTRALQLEHAYGLARFIGLSSNETDYFLLLVQHEHAGSEAFRSHLKKRIESSKEASQEIKARVSKDIQLSEQAKAEFYSHWMYSAVRLLTDVERTRTAGEISEALNVDVSKVSEILRFLVENKLCAQEGGKYKMAVQSTHLENNSPWIYSRQLQWRQLAAQKMGQSANDSLYYTGPMVLSEKDRSWARTQLVETIREITERARKSPSESLLCLNIDWFPVYSNPK